MAGQAKRDPATQRVACPRDGVTLCFGKQKSFRLADARRLGGRVKPGHDEFFLVELEEFRIYVRFVGTHKEYDGIDANTI